MSPVTPTPPCTSPSLPRPHYPPYQCILFMGRNICPLTRDTFLTVHSAREWAFKWGALADGCTIYDATGQLVGTYARPRRGAFDAPWLEVIA